MRVISGIARGRRLRSLEGNDVRPTTDKVKEAVFSAIQFDIEGRRFLDLFAGSGQIGLEALSRGAASCVFVDKNDFAIKVVRENVSACGFEGLSKVVKSDSLSFLNTTNEKFDIAFLDPPYLEDMLEKSLILVSEKMSDFGTIICEHPAEVVLPEQVGDFYVYRKYRYGKINVTTYKKDSI